MVVGQNRGYIEMGGWGWDGVGWGWVGLIPLPGVLHPWFQFTPEVLDGFVACRERGWEGIDRVGKGRVCEWG